MRSPLLIDFPNPTVHRLLATRFFVQHLCAASGRRMKSLSSCPLPQHPPYLWHTELKVCVVVTFRALMTFSHIPAGGANARNFSGPLGSSPHLPRDQPITGFPLVVRATIATSPSRQLTIRNYVISPWLKVTHHMKPSFPEGLHSKQTYVIVTVPNLPGFSTMSIHLLHVVDKRVGSATYLPQLRLQKKRFAFATKQAP